jgi:hypothetical protein
VDVAGTGQGMCDADGVEVDAQDEEHRGYTQQHCRQK